MTKFPSPIGVIFSLIETKKDNLMKGWGVTNFRLLSELYSHLSNIIASVILNMKGNISVSYRSYILTYKKITELVY